MSDEGISIIAEDIPNPAARDQPRQKAFHLTRRLSVSATPLFTTIEEIVPEKPILDEATLNKINLLLEAFPKPPVTTVDPQTQSNNVNRQSISSTTSSNTTTTSNSGWGFKGIAERFFSKS